MKSTRFSGYAHTCPTCKAIIRAETTVVLEMKVSEHMPACHDRELQKRDSEAAKAAQSAFDFTRKS